MEKYFLNETPDKITIITAMYARITTNEWTGNENEEVNIYKNTKNRILKALIHKKNEKERFEKLMSLEDTKPVEISQWKKDAEENINKLQTILKHRIESKSVFYRSTVSRLCSQLHKKLSNTNVEDLTYDNPLASGIICNESELVKNLPQDCQEEFQAREIESPSSKARKKSHGNKPDFMLRVKVSDKELELVNMETGRPESDWRKQISDHNRLARGAKDAFEDFSINARMLFYRYTTRRYKKYKSSVSGVKQTFVTIGTPKGIKKR
ncbi:hypothetical protein C2G38_2275677 [Gigaspora rosea]|uniref:Uncharacterized protein n=1 Tax=Gigaspora rosea TaxID=44941 RepID=A0A397U9P7_9GLOM|nr:hypothetical protein C2G38_2275677 [Gigaspora rosea]